MTHPTTFDDRTTPSAVEQDTRECDWDRSWGPFEGLRETGHLGIVVVVCAAAVVGIYAAGYLASNGDLVGGLVIGVVSVVGCGLWLDTALCKGTPAHVHECRHCRRATDRWRGPTRDEQWVTSVFGQQSAAGSTPAAARYGRPDGEHPEPWSWHGDAEPAVRPVTKPRPAPAGSELFDTVVANDVRGDELEDLPPELREDLEERLEAMADVLSPEELADQLSPDSESDHEQIVVDEADGGVR